MNNYNFSVVIPSYNLGKTLDCTVDSILNQTLNNVEIIIVDDASTDKFTIDRINKLKSNKDIKVIFLDKNGGIAHTRNTGIKRASSNYILCIDSDDYIEATYLEKAKKIFDQQKKVGIISTWYNTFGDINSIWKYRDDFNIIGLLVENKIPSGSCVRKSIYKDIGFYDENRKLMGLDDWDLWIRIFMKAEYKQVVIPEPLFFYNIRSSSVQHSRSTEKLEDSLNYLSNKHKELIKEYSLQIFKNLQKTTTLYRLKLRNQSKINSDLKNTKSFLLGDLFFRSIKKPYKLITFPINFIKILYKKND